MVGALVGLEARSTATTMELWLRLPSVIGLRCSSGGQVQG